MPDPVRFQPLQNGPPAEDGGLVSALKNLWDKANTGLVTPETIMRAATGHTIEEVRDQANEAPSDWDVQHPILGGLRRGALGAAADTADVASSFTSPVSIALAGTGAAGKLPGAAGKVARAANLAADATFAGQGAKQVVDAGTSNTPEAWEQRLQGAGQMAMGGHAAAGHFAPTLHPEIAETIAADHNAHGGSTVNLKTGESMAGKPLYAVSLAPELAARVPGPEITADHIQVFASHPDVAAALKQPNTTIGTWFDPESNTSHIDLTHTGRNRLAALEAGQANNQLGITNLRDLSFHPTGGTGEMLLPGEQSSSVLERVNQLNSAQPTETPYAGTHFSKANLKPDEEGNVTLSGARRGSSAIGEESARLQAGRGAPGGVYSYRMGTLGEPQVVTGRPNEYHIVGKYAIADLNDPQWKSVHQQAFDQATSAGMPPDQANQVAINEVEHAIHDSGYHGYENKQGAPGNVFFFDDVKARPAGAPRAPLTIAPQGRLAAQRGSLSLEDRTLNKQRLNAPEKGNTDVRTAANQYNSENGLPAIKAGAPVDVDPRAKQIADAYAAMPHSPNDPATQSSYASFKNDVGKQWDFATKRMGISFEPWTQEGQPYANSRQMMDDVRNNKHLYFFQGGDLPADHPMAQVNPQTGLTYNDMFRAVHDLFGHAKEGFEFGPKGEENAWLQHKQMFSPASVPALTSETRGQNSWVNFGAHLRDQSGNIPEKGQPGFVAPQDRPFGEQKAGLLPSEFNDRPQMAGTAAGAARDTELFQQAKRELPNGTMSDWARRAQELKTAPPQANPVAPAQANPVASPAGSTVPLQAKPLEMPNSPGKEEVAQTLQNWTTKTSRLRALDLATHDPSKLTDRAMRLGTDELKYQMAQESSGRGWYRGDVQRMRDAMQTEHPELANDKQFGLFTAIASALSPAHDSLETMKTAHKAYSMFKDSGRVPTAQEDGTAWGTYASAYRGALGTIQKVLDMHDGDIGKAYDWLREKHPGKELKQINKNFKGSVKQNYYGSMAMGPKVGEFFQNLNGVTDSFTMDSWAARTWRRWMGTLLNEDGTVRDANIKPAERGLAKQAFTALGKQFNLDTDDTQAMLWYYEQRLWRNHGLDIEDGVSYGDAAEKFVKDLRSKRNGATGAESVQNGPDAERGGVHEGNGESAQAVPAGLPEGSGDASFDFGANAGVRFQPAEESSVPKLVRNASARMTAAGPPPRVRPKK